jgi:putative DNA primase/helicase
MRGEFFSFTPTGKIWLSTNHMPNIRGTDEGIWRRIRKIPFNVRFHQDTPENAHLPAELTRDNQLPEKLNKEMPGILRWAVEGALEWRLNSLGAPAEVTEATNEYRLEMDSLAIFLNEKCVLKANTRVQASELYGEYRKWCEINGEQPVSNKVFGSRLKEKGFEKRTINGRNWYFGVGLLESGIESVDRGRGLSNITTENKKTEEKEGNDPLQPSTLYPDTTIPETKGDNHQEYGESQLVRMGKDAKSSKVSRTSDFEFDFSI